VEFGDGIDPVEASGRALPLAMLPGIPGPLSLGHPQACQVLLDAAAENGATVIRGIGDVTIETEGTPSVCWEHNGVETVATCRLIVGADGRGSTVRRQAGIELHQDPTHHFFAGLLVEGADEWPTDIETMGTEGDVQFFVFPQAPGRARLYLSYAIEQKSRFAGNGNEQKFLEAFRLKSVPNSESIAKARIAGPCHSIPNQSTWTERPVRPGLVLLGDAAGYNDPIVGQGLSISMRDIRVVSELLLGSDKWDEALLEPYVEERAERMRRLRVAATMDSVVHAEFGPEATARKLRLMKATQADPTLGLARAGVMLGPEMIPAEAFTEEALERVRRA
jgi:2-polyprenyl-6-methoxyphenol hydroxylase-like FAD-dependent oxidoreductase